MRQDNRDAIGPTMDDAAYFPDLPDPYPVFARQREEAAALHLVLPDGPRLWVVTRHAGALALLGEEGLIKDQARAQPYLAELGEQTVDSRAIPTVRDAVSSDPPEHARLRRIVADAFTPVRVRALTPLIESTAHRIIDRFAHRGQADLIADFAFPLPIAIICEILGVPADSEQFRVWSIDLVDGDLATAGRAYQHLAGYFDQLLVHKRANPADDLLSTLLRRGEQVGDALAPDELCATALMLLTTGFATVVNLIGNGVLALLDNPAQLDVLRRCPPLVPVAVEELLRYVPPVQLTTFRCATRPLAFSGTTVPLGSVVVANLASANRDPAVFADPDRLDVTRPASRHLSFGYGRHYCLGAPLARLEGAIAFAALLKRLPELHLAVPRDEIRWRPSQFMRGLRELPVQFQAEPPARTGGGAG